MPRSKAKLDELPIRTWGHVQEGHGAEREQTDSWKCHSRLDRCYGGSGGVWLPTVMVDKDRAKK